MSENNKPASTSGSKSNTASKNFVDQLGEFILDNIKAIALVLIVFIVVGAGVASYNMWNSNKETELQAQLAEIEFKHFELQSKVEEEKAKVENEKNQKGKKDAKAPIAAPVAINHAQEFDKILGDYKALALKAPQSQAGKMSYIYLVDLSIKKNKLEQVKDVTSAVEKSLKADLISDLTRFQIANFYTELSQCEEANKYLSAIINNKDSATLHKEARLRSALCYEKLGDLARAKSLLQEVANNSAGDDGFGSTQDAKKYLRYLNFTSQATGEAKKEVQ